MSSTIAPDPPPALNKKPAPRRPGILDYLRGIDVLAELPRAAREFGDVLRTPRGWFFFHPDAIRDVFVTHDKLFVKTPALHWTRFTLGNGLLTSEGEFHRRNRRLIQPSLASGQLSGYGQIMTRHALALSETWRSCESVELHRDMMGLTLRIVAETLFGADLGDEVSQISHAMDMNVRMFQRLVSPLGMIKAFTPTPFLFRFLYGRHRLRGTLRRIIAARRASRETRDDLLSRLLRARDSEDGGGLTERQLVAECVTLFAAGHETTANAMTFTLWLLAKHPEVAEKLQIELDRVLPDRRLPTTDDLDRLPFTRAVIAESMRLYPPAWIVGRKATAACEIDGAPIKKGTILFLSQWVTHRDPRWWPDPERFDPERFLSSDRSARPKWSYFPFGGGMRNCVGEMFAWAEAMLVLATLAQRFSLRGDAAQPLALQPGITLRPAKEVVVQVTGR